MKVRFITKTGILFDNGKWLTYVYENPFDCLAYDYKVDFLSIDENIYDEKFDEFEIDGSSVMCEYDLGDGYVYNPDSTQGFYIRGLINDRFDLHKDYFIPFYKKRIEDNIDKDILTMDYKYRLHIVYDNEIILTFNGFDFVEE